MNDIVDKNMRDFNRYTGDGLPNEPVGAPLPVGDPTSGAFTPAKRDLRQWAADIEISAAAGTNLGARIDQEILDRQAGDDAHSEGTYYAGPWDASTGAFPAVRGAGGAVQLGDYFDVSVAGTVDGQAFEVGERIKSLVDTPSTTTLAGNWYHAETVAILAPVYAEIDGIENTLGARSADITTRGVVDVFVVYGQSNALGSPLTAVGALPWINPSAEMYNGYDVVPLANTMETPTGGTSIGSAWAAFANEYIERTGRKCLIINAARGSQSIADLQKGTANYTGMSDWLSDAISEITSRGDTVGEVAMLFNQGERDQLLKTSYDDYYANLAQLWTDVKADTDCTRIYIWTLGLYLSAAITGAWPVQLAQKAFCSDNDDAMIAYDYLGGFNSANGLSDNTHYTMAGYNKMGREGAKTVADIIMDNGVEGNAMPEQFGQLMHSNFQRQQRACATLVKGGSGLWVFGNTTGYSGSFISSIDSTTNDDELLLGVSAPVIQYLEFNAQTQQTYHLSGLEAALRVGSDTDDLADDVIGIKYRMVEIPLRIDMTTETFDCASLGTAFASLLDSITMDFTDTGDITITHPEQKGLPLGIGRGVGGTIVNLYGNANTTTVRVTDATGTPKNDSITVALRSVVIPLADVPTSTATTVGLTFSTYNK